EAKSRIGDAGGAEVSLQGIEVLDNFLPPISAEIPVAEVAFGEADVLGEVTTQRAFVEWDAGENADVELLCEREQSAPGSLVEDVVNHLNGIDQASFADAEDAIGVVLGGGNAGETDLAGAAEVFEGAAPFVARGPIGAPDVELQQVDGIELQVAE